ncbi:ECF transporter S component [Sinanaerobacter sp. ZZT-01]|uniref:ECF transporter S component n=1 Tax=Sinanaerobacter sp. ZZT-01 TaxID=3111540 RepID=UPI002D793FA5|nr:ECF transporter S component [Sinanaerobacter sp. ZZT-01]WRR94409.1 ECF transporter S component [Sinanaerobacter sp. ZZT-01]
MKDSQKSNNTVRGQSQRTAKLVKMAMLAAISLALVLIVRIPFPPAPFLVYDPADVPIFIGTFAFGPMAGFMITAAVSFIQAFPLGGDGPIGFCMHLFATGSFVLVAGFLYQKNKTRKGAILALFSGALIMTVTMLLWNILITPIYMGVPRDVVMGMIVPIVLPFNLLKSGINAVITFVTYKSIAKFLHR